MYDTGEDYRLKKGEKMDIPDGKPRYFDDDGNELNPGLVPKPIMCIACARDDDPNEEMLCNLNRLDQKDEEAFGCAAFEPKHSD